jgi:hypothetical protein
LLPRRGFEELHQLINIQEPSATNQEVTGGSSANQETNRSTTQEPQLLSLVDHVAKLIEENRTAVNEVKIVVYEIQRFF